MATTPATPQIAVYDGNGNHLATIPAMPYADFWQRVEALYPNDAAFMDGYTVDDDGCMLHNSESRF